MAQPVSARIVLAFLMAASVALSAAPLRRIATGAGQSAPGDPPIAAKQEFIRNFQANFGTIKLPGCGLHLDNLFDPFLLIAWLENRPCFDRMMNEHARRNDNVVVVDPKSGYHGHNDVDLWHEPTRFAEFLRDIRRRTNGRGEHFRVLLFLAGDGHINDMRADGALTHWKRDVDALAAAAEPVVDATVPSWECRPQNDYVSASGYIQMARYAAQKFPRAVHAQHLSAGASSWSSWPCDPRQDTTCTTVPSNDADDPNRGDSAAAWKQCRAEGWCDLLLYQFDVGDAYLHPEDADPNYTGHPGALGPWYEIAVRLGDDPRSAASAQGNRHGWVQAPIVAFEFIYDTYWSRDPRATEAYAVQFCRRALAIGGWGCGSASYRRP
jgi:hypothetical protein